MWAMKRGADTLPAGSITPRASVAARALLPVAMAAGLAFGLTACQDNETAIMRGDRLWADSSFTSAVVEYRLAVAQRGDEAARARLAHGFAVIGQVDAAADVYAGLIERSPEVADQAVYDLLRLARRSERRNDIFRTVTAVDAALLIRPVIRLPETALAAARFYRDQAEPERALDYYARALTTLDLEESPRVLHEIGLLLEDQGRCRDAMDFYRLFEETAGTDRRWVTLIGEARWHTGSCAFRLAAEAIEEGRLDDALDRLDTTIGIGEPENLLDQAFYERGEILYSLGRYDEALEEYRRVLQRSPARRGRIVVRAQERIDEIRFGRTPSPGEARADTLPR